MDNGSAIPGNNVQVSDPVEAVTSEDVVPDNKTHAEDYKQWLEKASEVCGYEMTDTVDPVSKQAENVTPDTDESLKAQLGLEDLTDIMLAIESEDDELDGIDPDTAAEIEELDELSRGMDITAEDIGMCPDSGTYAIALEQAWAKVEQCKHNLERLQNHEEETKELVVALESDGMIDIETAIRLKERIPGALAKANMKTFTRKPSYIGYKLAHESATAGKIVIGGLVLAGGVYLAYKLLTYTSDSVKETGKTQSRVREKTTSLNRTMLAVNRGTLNAEKLAEAEKLAKSLFVEPTFEVTSKMTTLSNQPGELRNIKWTEVKDFNHLKTKLLRMLTTDGNGTDASMFNDKLNNLTNDAVDAMKYLEELLQGLVDFKGEDLHAPTVLQGIEEQLLFVNKYIDDWNVPITFSSPSTIERCKGLTEWLSDKLEVDVHWKLQEAPSLDVVTSMGRLNLRSMNDELAKRISDVRGILDPKGKVNIVGDDTPAQADIRKEIIRDITLAFMALSNIVRFDHQYTVYLDQLVTAEDSFAQKVKRNLS